MKRHESQSCNRIGMLICGHTVLQFLQNSAVNMENCQTREQTCCLWYTIYCHKHSCYSPLEVVNRFYDSIVTILHFIVHNFLYIASQLFFWFNFSHRLVDFFVISSKTNEFLSVQCIMNWFMYFMTDFRAQCMKPNILCSNDIMYLICWFWAFFCRFYWIVFITCT